MECKLIKLTPTVSSICTQALITYQFSDFVDQLQSSLSQFAYPLFIGATERTYHGMLLGLIRGMGIEVVAEQLVNTGSIDLVLELPKVYYVLELKLDKPVAVALEQIHERGYYKAFLHQGKEVALIGVSLSSAQRNIDDWTGELLDDQGQRLSLLQP